MENLDALIAIQRGGVLDQDILSRLVGSKLVDVVTTQLPGRELMFVGFTPEGYRMLEQNKALLVSDLERRILHAVVRGFLDQHEPTSAKTLLKKFKSPIATAVQRLTHRGALQVINNTYRSETYLPQAIAFYHCGDSAALAFARKSTELVLRVLPKLFDTELDNEGTAQKQFTPEDVLKEVQVFDSSADVNTILSGIYLAREFSVFGGYRTDNQVTYVSFSLNERVYDTRALDWNEHIQRSNAALVNDWDHAKGKSSALAVGPGVPSTGPPIDFERLLPQIDSDRTLARREEIMHLLVLISHSSKDQKLASALIDFLRSGLGLLPKQIRCTSVDGYRLPAGVHTETQLHDEVKSSKVLVGLITANSLGSPYVMFELGARWGAGALMMPLLAGVTGDQLRGPLSGMNALLCSSEEQLHQALSEIGSHLGLEVQSPAAYLKQLRAVVKRAAKVLSSNPSSAPTVLKVKPKLVHNAQRDRKPKPLIVPLRYGHAPTSAGKHMLGYHGLIVANHGEPAYDVSILSSEIPIGTSKLRLEGEKSHLTKADGDAFFKAGIRQSPGSWLTGNGLFDEMRKHHVTEIIISLLYKDGGNRWYKTIGKIERNVSEPGGLSVKYVRQEQTKPPKQST